MGYKQVDKTEKTFCGPVLEFIRSFKFFEKHLPD